MSGSPAGRRVAFAALIASGLAAGTARAADDGYDNVISSVLGAVGIIKGDAPPEIEYRERPPLVLPRSAALPKPAAVASKRSPAWPQDPDVVRRRKEAEEARAPQSPNAGVSDKGVLLSREDELKGRAAGEPVRPNECGNDGQHCLILNPNELRAEGERFRAANPEKSDTLVAGKEPDRMFLTQPPKGYLKPARSVKATTEAPEEKLNDSSPRYMQELEAKKKAEQE